MMDFIMLPSIIGIVTLGIYKLFELFARRKERLMLIEKMGANIDPSLFQQKLPFPQTELSNRPFGALKLSCLLIGVGLGLLIGFTISVNCSLNIESYHHREILGIAYGASVLLCAGLGLLTAFLIEMKYMKKEDENNSTK